MRGHTVRGLARSAQEARFLRSRSLPRWVGVALVAVLMLAGCEVSGADPVQGKADDGDPEPAGEPILQPSEPFERATVTLRSPDGEQARVPVYVAAEPSERSRGLMDRDELPEGAGMIFLFPEDVTSSFYMYRTRIPLSIAFSSAEGEVLAVLDMEPCPRDDPADCELYDPGVPYRNALEVNQGFFDSIGLDEGWTVELPADLPTPG